MPKGCCKVRQERVMRSREPFAKRSNLRNTDLRGNDERIDLG